MNENRNIPKLRFPKFTEEWEKESFDSAFSSLRNNTLSRADLNDISGKAQDIHYGDVLIKYGDCLDVVKENIPYISDNKTAEKYSDSYLHDGDVVIADTAEDETAGKCTEICDIGGSNVVAGLHTMPVRPTHEFAPGYLGHYLNSHAYHDQLLPLMQGKGTKVTSVPKNSIRKTVIKYPSDINEQQRIGSFFSKIDSIIASQQQYVDQLKEFKNGCLQKMFPKKGEKVPEMRFPGAYNDKGEWAAFTDDWEQRKFSDITFPAGEKNKDNLPLKSYSITNEYGFVPQDEKFENGGTMREADKRMYYIVSPNSFAYNPARINVGSIGYQNTSKNVIVSSLYEVFKTTDDVDDRFLWHWFKSNDFKKMILRLQEGGVRLYFYYDKLCMGSIAMPTLPEQKLIGAYLDKLDNLITLHQCKLDEMKGFKKGCLQKMFV